jgi:hypothetical protein
MSELESKQKKDLAEILMGEELKLPETVTLNDLQNLLTAYEESTQGVWEWEKNDDRGTITVYSKTNTMQHGYNLFGRMECDKNGEDNVEFITQIHNYIKPILEELIEVRRSKGEIRQINPTKYHRDKAIKIAKQNVENGIIWKDTKK